MSLTSSTAGSEPVPNPPVIRHRRNGCVWGAFVAESLSLGVHWNYDPEDIAARHGRVADYLAPGPQSYHPHKKAGDQGHVGDQSLCLLRHLAQGQGWHISGFLNEWQALWPQYTDYVDKATKTTLASLAEGLVYPQCGSTSDELAGPARLAPLLALLSHADGEEALASAVEQTIMTHRSPEATQAAVFLSRLVYDLTHGADFLSSLEEHCPRSVWQAVGPVLDLSPNEAIGQLGRSCSTGSALPGVVYLLCTHPSAPQLEDAFIANAMAGGDNCARGLVLGMILGAAHGVETIPARWRQALRAGPEIDSFLAILP